MRSLAHGVNGPPVGLNGVEVQTEAILEPDNDAPLVGLGKHGRRARDRWVDRPGHVQFAPLDARQRLERPLAGLLAARAAEGGVHEPRLSRFVDGRSPRTFQMAMASIGAAHAELPAGVA